MASIEKEQDNELIIYHMKRMSIYAFNKLLCPFKTTTVSICLSWFGNILVFLIQLELKLFLLQISELRERMASFSDVREDIEIFNNAFMATSEDVEMKFLKYKTFMREWLLCVDKKSFTVTK